LARAQKLVASTDKWDQEYSQRHRLAAAAGVPVEFLVVVEKGKASYGAYVPDLPGCVAVIREMRQAGESVPTPTSKSEIVKIRAA
jgi:hypothetical protein